MGRFFLSCSEYGTRMRRTGMKEKEERSVDDVWFYLREYACPNCGTVWLYSENWNVLTQGSVRR